jgi:integrase
MSSHALYYAITRCSARLLGAPLNPHLLRDCAVSSITANAPEFTLAAARVLGHSQLSTTLTHYDQASMLKAGQYHAEILEEIKNAATRRKSAENPYSPEDVFYDPWPLEDKEQI